LQPTTTPIDPTIAYESLKLSQNVTGVTGG